MPPTFPEQTRVTLEFQPMGDKTELTWTEYHWPVGEMRHYSILGINESLDKLAEVLAEN